MQSKKEKRPYILDLKEKVRCYVVQKKCDNSFDTCPECTGFIIMPTRPYEWRVGAHGCYKFDNADLQFGPHDQTAHFPVFFHLRTTNLPGPDSITRSSKAQLRRMERTAGKCERKRIRKQLAQQATTNPLTSET